MEERAQVDNVINFFTDTSKNVGIDFLDDDDFYKLDNPSGSGTGNTENANIFK